jgi:thiol-disulfide isomerase/thioredoxin
MWRRPEWCTLAVLLSVALLLAPGPARAQLEPPELSHRLTPLASPVVAENFVLEDMDGKRHALEDYRGKVVLINFWATWCPPCVREMPSLERLYQELGDKSFVVLAINQWENTEHVFAFMGQIDVFPSFPILFDPDSAVSEAFGVKGLPTSFLLDRTGRVVYRAVGGRQFDNPEILQVIEELLGR